MRKIVSLSFACCLAMAPAVRAGELGDEGFVDSGGVKIHYVTKGQGPLLILMHGFPDYHYTWRDQIPPLAKHFQVVAIDLRGYNKSDQPKGVENYTLDKLVGDVDAVVKHFKQKKAVVVGHDWGGIIAWSYAMAHPVEYLSSSKCLCLLKQRQRPRKVWRYISPRRRGGDPAGIKGDLLGGIGGVLDPEHAV